VSSDNNDPLESTTLNALKKQYDFLEAQNFNLVEVEQQRRLQTSSDYLESATSQLPPLSDLMKGAQASNLHIDEKYDHLLALLIHLSNHSMKAYKQVQNVIGEVDDKINSEFCYLARAETSIIYAVLTKKYDTDFELALIDAITSTRHIINDCLDIIAIHANKCYLSILDRYDTIKITPHYKNFDNIKPLIREALELAATTRFTRGTSRIQEYLNFIEDGDKLPQLIDFCEVCPDLMYNLNQIFQDKFDSDQLIELRSQTLEKKLEEIDSERSADSRHKETILNNKINADKQRNTYIIMSALGLIVVLLGIILRVVLI
jgi:hypothetical protein